VWGAWRCGRCGGVGSLLTFDIPQTALVTTLDTYDFIIILKVSLVFLQLGSFAQSFVLCAQSFVLWSLVP
jgi:hypothetical protein